MSKQCTFHINGGTRCRNKTMLEADESRPIINKLIQDPNNPENTCLSRQVWRPTKPDGNFCYYHAKLMKGYFYDSRGASPNNAKKKRDAAQRAEKETRKDKHAYEYPPAKPPRTVSYGEGIQFFGQETIRTSVGYNQY